MPLYEFQPPNTSKIPELVLIFFKYPRTRAKYFFRNHLTTVFSAGMINAISKPLSKSSRYGVHFQESRRRCDCGRQGRIEWTYEGRPKAAWSRVVSDGIFARYKGSAHVGVRSEWVTIVLSILPIWVVPQECLLSLVARGRSFFI